MPAGWKNPIRKVKAPKLPTDPIEPIQIEEIHQLLKTCQSNYFGVRDKAMMLGLLDTGARAKEFLNINLEDVDLATGAVMIRQGIGRNPSREIMLPADANRATRLIRYLLPPDQSNGGCGTNVFPIGSQI